MSYSCRVLWHITIRRHNSDSSSYASAHHARRVRLVSSSSALYDYRLVRQKPSQRTIRTAAAVAAPSAIPHRRTKRAMITSTHPAQAPTAHRLRDQPDHQHHRIAYHIRTPPYHTYHSTPSHTTMHNFISYRILWHITIRHNADPSSYASRIMRVVFG